MIENLMFNTARVETPTYSQDSSGAEVITDWTEWTLAYDEIPCSVQPSTASETQYYMQRGMEVTAMIYTNYVADYQRNWRLIVEGKKYYINGVRDFVTLHRIVELACSEYPSTAKRR